MAFLPARSAWKLKVAPRCLLSLPQMWSDRGGQSFPANKQSLQLSSLLRALLKTRSEAARPSATADLFAATREPFHSSASSLVHEAMSCIRNMDCQRLTVDGADLFSFARSSNTGQQLSRLTSRFSQSAEDIWPHCTLLATPSEQCGRSRIRSRRHLKTPARPGCVSRRAVANCPNLPDDCADVPPDVRLHSHSPDPCNWFPSTLAKREYPPWRRSRAKSDCSAHLPARARAVPRTRDTIRQRTPCASL